MKGFLRISVAGLCLGAGLSSIGCVKYRQCVDPCWPERYNAEARFNVRETFAAQAWNGHLLDQTIWNFMFEPDAKGGPSDKLNPAGKEHLHYLARRKPYPDAKIYLQTANDVPGSQNMPPERVATAKADLDNRRISAIQNYLAGVMGTRTAGTVYEVAVADPMEPSIAATAIGGSGTSRNPVIPGAIPQWWVNFKGKMPGAEGITMGASGSGGQ